MVREEYNATAATKLTARQFDLLRNTCNFGHLNQSEFIRNAILEKLKPGQVSNVAGKNKIAHDARTDSFIWKIELDTGEEQTILTHLSLEFVQDLQKQLSFELNKRAESLNKKNKGSVAVPKRLIQ